MSSSWKIIKLNNNAYLSTNLNVHDNGVANKLTTGNQENYFIKVIS